MPQKMAKIRSFSVSINYNLLPERQELLQPLSKQLMFTTSSPSITITASIASSQSTFSLRGFNLIRVCCDFMSMSLSNDSSWPFRTFFPWSRILSFHVPFSAFTSLYQLGKEGKWENLVNSFHIAGIVNAEDGRLPPLVYRCIILSRFP